VPGFARNKKDIKTISKENLLNKRRMGAAIALVLAVPVSSVNAASIAVDCNKKASVNAALGKLDRSAANTLTISGSCTENVVVSGHRDLTIVGATGASLTATVVSGDNATDTVTINGNSRVTIQSLLINAGQQGVYCDDRSACILKNVTISGGTVGGLSVQKQSSADVLGTSSIAGSGGNGIGVFGASSVNVGDSDDPAAPPGPVISGHAGAGAQVQDGSFLRTDNVTFSNNGFGVFADRGAVIKILGALSAVTGSAYDGISVRASTAQVAGTISGPGARGGSGGGLKQLAYVQFNGATVTGSGSGGPGAIDVFCVNSSSITNPSPLASAPNRITFGTTNCP
jgi:hypothetical protein